MEKMDSSLNMIRETFCRACANTCVRSYAINSKICNFSTTIKDMIVLLVPQMETVLNDNDFICNFCRKTLIHCVRFIDKCLRVEADRKEKVLCQKNSTLDIVPVTNLKDDAIEIEVDNFIHVDQKEVDNFIHVDQKEVDNFIHVAQKKVDNFIHVDQKEVDNFIHVDQKDTSTSSLNGDVGDKETDQVMDIRSDDNNGIDDISQNDVVDELPSTIIPHNRLISNQMRTDKLNEFSRILASNDVRTIQYSQDSGTTTERKRVILLGSTFKCGQCHAYFDYRGKYTTHLRMHERFERKQEERNRLRKLRIQRLQEKEARKLGTQMNGYERKKRKPNLECKICSEKMSSIEDLQLHYKIHPRYICEKCGKVFAQRTQMYAHKGVHNEQKSYVCEICGKSFKTRTQLTRHALMHQNIAHACDKCPKVFETVFCLRNHLRNTHGVGRSGIWPCQECGKIFKRSHLYQTHYRQIHLRTGPRICDICGQGFYRSDYLTRHKRRHLIFGETQESFKNGELPSNATDSTFRRLPRGTLKEANINKKIRRKKLPPGPYTCQICMKVYVKMETLKRHILSHGTRRYNCKFCSRTFKLKYLLTSHEKCHEMTDLSDKYRCGNCWKLFETPEDLELHHITTHGNLKYPCELCEESFAREHLLNDHLTNVHAEEDDAEEEMRSLMSTGLGTTLFSLMNIK